jgi:hypothetical protein
MRISLLLLYTSLNYLDVYCLIWMPGKCSTELKEQSGFQYLHRARNGKWDCYLSYEWYLSIPKVGSNQYLLPFLLAELEKGQTRYHPVH